MSDIVNSMSIAPLAPQVNMQIYTNKFDNHRAIYAENKMLYEKARLQMAKDEQSVGSDPQYQDIVKQTWNKTFGSINEAIEVGDFIGLEGIIDNAALDYATDWNLNTAKSNVASYNTAIENWNKNETKKGGLQTSYLRQTQPLPNLDKDGNMVKKDHYEYGADYYDINMAVAKLTSLLERNVEITEDMSINDVKFVTVDDITVKDGKLLTDLETYANVKAKYKDGIVYIKYNEHSESTKSTDVNGKGRLLLNILKKDHNAVAYFQSMSNLSNKLGYPKSADELMEDAISLPDWEAALRGNVEAVSNKERLMNVPQSSTKDEEPVIYPTDAGFQEVEGTEAGYNKDYSTHKSRDYDRAKRVEVFSNIKSYNDELVTLYKQRRALEEKFNNAMAEYNKDITNATKRGIVSTASKELNEFDNTIDQVLEKRREKINYIRATVPKARENIGLDVSTSIMTKDEIVSEMNNASNSNFKDYNSELGIVMSSQIWSNPLKDSGYKSLSNLVVSEFNDTLERVINEDGETSKIGILRGMANRYGIEVTSEDDPLVISQAIKAYLFTRDMNMPNSTLTEEGYEYIMNPENDVKTGIDYYLNKGLKKIEKFTGKIKDEIENTDYVINYKYTPNAEDSPVSNAINTFITPIVTQGGKIYDKWGDVIPKDSDPLSTHGIYVNDEIRNKQEINAYITGDVKGDKIGIYLHGYTPATSNQGTYIEPSEAGSLVYISKSDAISAITQAQSKLAKINAKDNTIQHLILPNGLTQEQNRAINSKLALFDTSDNGTYASTAANIIDLANDGFLLSSGNGNQTFNHSFDISNEINLNYVNPNTRNYELINSNGESEYVQFDYLKRAGNVAIQVTVPMNLTKADGSTYNRNVSMYAYSLDVPVTKEVLDLYTNGQLQELDAVKKLQSDEISNFIPVVTNNGIIILTYEENLHSEVLGDFKNGVDAMMATNGIYNELNSKGK